LKKKTKIIVLVSILSLTLYFGIGAIRYFSNSYETEVALSFQVEDSVKVDGLLIREETVINTPRSENVHYLLTDGSRVSKSNSVAVSYKNSVDSELQMQINALEKQKAVLEASQNEGAMKSYDVDLVSKQIDKYFGNVFDKANVGVLSDFTEDKDDLLIYLNRRRLSLGIEDNYDAGIQDIESEIKELKNKFTGNYSVITSHTSGFFVSGSDGYENSLSCKDCSQKSYSEKYDIITGNSQIKEESGYVGKIITDYVWNYAFTTTSKVADRLKAGSTIDVNFSFNGSSKMKMNILSVEYSDEKDEAVVVLSCDEMSEYISSARFYSADIIFNSYNGLKINKDSLRMRDEEKGVYIRIGNQIVFKKVDILFEADGYVISKKGISDSSYLRIYDEIVVGGKNLYDGKHIN
jgi:hypothetical protein